VVGTVTLASGGSMHQAVDIIGHPQYQSDGFGTYENDISLVEVETDIVFNQNVAPVVLGKSLVGGGINAVLAG
jgi:hypothetical protein